MALFGRRPEDVDARIVAEARTRFAELGVETTVRGDGAPSDAILIATDRREFPMHNLLAVARHERGRERTRLIQQHVRRMLQAMDAPPVSEMPAEELRTRVRTRLFPAEAASARPSIEYGRPVADDLLEALCIDLPETVVTISAEALPKLALPEEELYAFGRRNTDAEPVDDRTEVAPGVTLLGGESLFIASKAANLPAVIGPARYGTVFAVPQRHLLLVAPLQDAAGLQAIDGLGRVLLGVLSRGVAELPGGLLSSNLHFSRNGVVERVSEVDAEGGLRVLVDGGFAEALEELAAAQP